jgi:glucan biosynthesis protein C
MEEGANLRSLDALRAGAMLLGVLLHSIVPYLRDPVPHLLWAVRETDGGWWLDGLYWWIHGFRVPLFFFVAGLLAPRSLARRGAWDFARQRLIRLGLPLVVAMFTVVMPAMYLVWSWGWVRSGLAKPANILHVRFEHGIQQDLYGFAHLWFLQYLLIYSLIAAAVCGLLRTPTWLRVLIGRAPPIALVVLLAVPTSIIIAADPRPLTEFHNWFWPRGAEFVYHGWFYVAGWLVSGSVARWSGKGLTLGAGVLAGVAFIIIAAALYEGRAPSGAMRGFDVERAATSFFTWGMIAVCISWGLRRSPARAGGVVQYFADRAYWIYVLHPPIVGVVQVLLFGVAVPLWLKALVSCVVGTLVCLVLHTLVWKPLWGRFGGLIVGDREAGGAVLGGAGHKGRGGSAAANAATTL